MVPRELKKVMNPRYDIKNQHALKIKPFSSFRGRTKRECVMAVFQKKALLFKHFSA